MQYRYRRSLRSPEIEKLRSNYVTFSRLGHSGNLGNQLFQIAAVIGFARENGCRYVFPPWSYAEYFENPIPRIRHVHFAQSFHEHFLDRRNAGFSGPINLAGNFQSEKYFRHCMDEIRHSYTPRLKYLEHLHAKYGDILRHKTCSVHVRRGDYINNPNYAQLESTGYYENALSQFNQDTQFLFFSDDIRWCKTHFCDERYVFVEDQKDILDLFLMSLCRDHIIANSSFSWWGAWLNRRKGKKVIAPQVWFSARHSDPAQNQYWSTRNLFPESWIRL